VATKTRETRDAKNIEEIHRILFDEASAGIFILDSQGKFVEINQRWTEMTGYSREQILGMSITDLVVEEDPARDPIRTDDFRNGKIEVAEMHIRGSDGRRLRVEMSVRVLSVNRLLGIIRDITESKQAEETLRAERQFLSDVIDFLPDATFVIDVNQHIAAWNRAAEELTGVKRDELLGQGDYAYAVPFYGERHPILIDLLDVPEAALEKSYKFIRRSGKAIYAETFSPYLRGGRGAHLWGVAAPLYDRGGNRAGAVEVIRDITERNQAEEEKIRLQAQLLQAQKMESVGRLAGGVAHDFNNMLTVILCNLDLAMGISSPTEPISVHLRAIENATLSSASIVRQLLAFARKQTVAPRVLDLNDAVSNMLKILQRLIGEEIDFTWLPGAGLWPTRIDPSQVDQLLANLCVNARDAITGVGKIIIETGNMAFTKAHCAAHPDFLPGEFVMLAVNDDGGGMERDVLDHIFEPFYTTKEVGQGTGLGLATVYGIVKQNDGFIKVYSDPGNGTTFKIFLPRVAGATAEPLAASQEQTPAGHGETLLLVEDDTSILSASQMMLEKLGYRVLAASTPSRAIQEARDHAAEIQLLITDVVMPEMNGRDLAKELAEIIPGLKCLFSSGYTADVIAHRGILDEGLHFLQKPYAQKDLATKVFEALKPEIP
jgi:two-component system, cell cycle sensor histidine kinase and response regulator CckA